MEKYQAELALAGRGLLSILMFWAALFNLLNWSTQVAQLTNDQVPLPEVVLGAATGVEIVLGVPLLLGFRARGAALLLAAYTLVCAIVLHPFWGAAAGERANQMLHFFEGVGITGGLLMVAAFGPGRYSIDGK